MTQDTIDSAQFMRRQVDSEGLLRAMQDCGVDLAAPIGGEPAGHVWTRVAVAAEGFAQDDAVPDKPCPRRRGLLGERR